MSVSESLTERGGFLKPSIPRKGSRSARPSFVGMYDFKGTLGEGKYSVVKEATHVLSKDKVAVKVIDKAKLNEVELSHLHHEVTVMKLLRNPHVVRLYEIVDTSNWLYLIMELGDGGDMHGWLRNNKDKLTEPRARAIFAQLVIALSYCHKHRVAHRDLKPENVVFYTPKDEVWHGEEIVKVTDFGLSNSFKDNTMMNTWCGSLAYSAPEVLVQEPYLGPQADVWGLGIILYMLVCYSHPFQGHDENDTLVRIMDVRYRFPGQANRELRDLVNKMLQKDPADRLSLDEVEAHDWMQDPTTGDSVVTMWREREASLLKYANEAEASGDALSKNINSTMTGEEHMAVVRQMEQFNIAETDIDAALATGSYNYVSSTYCLLAEKQLRLRRRQQDAGFGGADIGSPRVDRTPARATTAEKPETPPVKHQESAGVTPMSHVSRCESDTGSSTDPSSTSRARPRRPNSIAVSLRPRNRQKNMGMTRWVSDHDPSDEGYSLGPLHPTYEAEPLSAGVPPPGVTHFLPTVAQPKRASEDSSLREGRHGGGLFSLLLESPTPIEEDSRSKSSEDVTRDESPGLSERAMPVASAPPINQSWAPSFNIAVEDFDYVAMDGDRPTVARAVTPPDVNCTDDDGTVIVSDDDCDSIGRLSVLDESRPLSRSLGGLHALCEEEEPNFSDADTKSL